MSAKALETPKTFALLAPIQSGTDTVSEVTLREPIVSEIDQLTKDEAKSGPIAAMVNLIGKQSKLPPVDVRNIGARDFNELKEYLISFLESKKESEERSSQT